MSQGWFQHTAARRRLVPQARAAYALLKVSTHSRPKAAGASAGVCLLVLKFQHTAARRRLVLRLIYYGLYHAFQHTAARRRLGRAKGRNQRTVMFQHTAARRRLAAIIGMTVIFSKFQHTAARRRLAKNGLPFNPYKDVSTHSRPKAAGTFLNTVNQTAIVSTHSRPKAAGTNYYYNKLLIHRVQHTAARRRLDHSLPSACCVAKFQHTAARRRLGG